MLDQNKWLLVDNNSTGYANLDRNAEWGKRDNKYGFDNWRIGWLVGDNLLGYREACKLFEDAYFEHFNKNPELLEQLVTQAANIYVYDPSDVISGLDYLKKGDRKTHTHDIAIRNCLKRFGKEFAGKELIHLSKQPGEHSLSVALSPGQVPFHQPELLSNPDNGAEIMKDAWWQSGSVEDFYQRGKRLCIRKKQ